MNSIFPSDMLHRGDNLYSVSSDRSGQENIKIGIQDPPKGKIGVWVNIRSVLYAEKGRWSQKEHHSI